MHAAAEAPLGADDLGVAGVSDQHELALFLLVAARLQVHLGDERARGVDRAQLPLAGLALDLLGHAVGAEDRDRAARDVVEGLDEVHAAPAEILEDVAVVHDLVQHVDRRAVELERAVDDLDRAVDAGAEAARRGEEHLQARNGHVGRG